MLFLKCKFDPTIFLVFIKTFWFLPFSKRSVIKRKDSAFRSGSLLPLQQHHVPLFPLFFVLNTHGFFPSSKVLPQDLQFYTFPFFRTGTGKLLRREGQIVSILGFVDQQVTISDSTTQWALQHKCTAAAADNVQINEPLFPAVQKGLRAGAVCQLLPQG